MLIHCKIKLKVDLTQGLSSQLQSGFIQVQAVAHLSCHSLGARPSKNQKGGSGKWDGLQVYTAAGMRAHFRLVLDHSDVCLLKMVTTQELTFFLFCFILESYKHQVGKIEHLYVSLVQQKTLQALQG